MYNYSELPESLRDGMQRYFRDGTRPGHFLTAVLENDLFGAVMRSDPNNLNEIPAIVKWLYNEVPLEAYGSTLRVNAWIEQWQHPYEEDSFLDNDSILERQGE
jgi:hypothetical protein